MQFWRLNPGLTPYRKQNKVTVRGNGGEQPPSVSCLNVHLGPGFMDCWSKRSSSEFFLILKPCLSIILHLQSSN
ncbi:hypothetical protein SLEP1_g48416 [Rubroshorea leprosula]|uniref:Uncharacterized protein n=1 Tax=Rubroshorea leprosula TaxID=152421 RepID=A0AAV5LUF5_9ROSI|nr:hypothetical protein SLEP1_g48416 [Rubroshorea leprosula]